MDFEVVGILEPTLTAPDSTAWVPLQAAQELYAASLPAAIQEAISTEVGEFCNRIIHMRDGLIEPSVA